MYTDKQIYTLFANETKEVRVTLNSRTFSEHIVTFKDPGTGAIGYFKPIPPSEITGIGENIEQTLKFGNFGVSQNNELSAGYNVRGGNFNENLIYVNDIQVYRPFLARSGQQEGLSFVNTALVQNLDFSAGGFQAKYGDKLSSVLDITYLSPDSLMGAFSASMLGGRLTLGNKHDNFSYVMSGRYKSNSYVLGALETQGDYKPVFFDYQTYLNYEVNDKLSFGFLGNSSLNKFRMVPQTRTTRFGGINEAFQLTVNFEGQEIDQFQTNFGAFTTDYKPFGNDSTLLKLTVSAFNTFVKSFLSKPSIIFFFFL